MSEKRSEPARSYSASPDVVAQEMGDQMVLVHLGTNRIHSLNATALRLWELLGDGRNRQEIEETLLAEFDVERGLLSSEIDATVAALAAADLLVVEEE